jgi:hypothetical protein
MDKVIKGEDLDKEKGDKKVRNWDNEKYGGAAISF